MDARALFSKIDFAAILALATGILYLWGWEYWADYYHYFGLPYSFGAVGFERLVMAGSWYLWFFASRAALGFLAFAVVVALIRRLRRKPLSSNRVTRWPKLQGKIGRLGSYLKKDWLIYFLILLFVCGGYTWSHDYIIRDAHRDAATRLRSRETVVSLQMKGNNHRLPAGELDLLEQRQEDYYFILHQDPNTTEIVVVRSADMDALLIRKLDSNTVTISHVIW